LLGGRYPPIKLCIRRLVLNVTSANPNALLVFKLVLALKEQTVAGTTPLTCEMPERALKPRMIAA
jgi:hypothetical protein